MPIPDDHHLTAKFPLGDVCETGFLRNVCRWSMSRATTTNVRDQLKWVKIIPRRFLLLPVQRTGYLAIGYPSLTVFFLRAQGNHILISLRRDFTMLLLIALSPA